jgi:hypothetical protein
MAEFVFLYQRAALLSDSMSVNIQVAAIGKALVFIPSDMTRATQQDH